MLSLAISRGEPAAIRYNRGSLMQAVSSVPVEVGRWEMLLPLQECTVIATGDMVGLALSAARELGAGLVNARFIKPMDEEMLTDIAHASWRVVVVEDGVDCLGKNVAVALPDCTVIRLHVPDVPVSHATVVEQRALCGLTEADIRRAILGEA